MFYTKEEGVRAKVVRDGVHGGVCRGVRGGWSYVEAEE